MCYAALLAAGAVVISISPSLAFADYTAGEIGKSSEASMVVGTHGSLGESSSSSEEQQPAEGSGASEQLPPAEGSGAFAVGTEASPAAPMPFQTTWGRFLSLSGTTENDFSVTQLQADQMGAPQLAATRVSLSEAYVERIADQVYTGVTIKPKPRVFVHGKELRYGRDYLLRYSANSDIGTATVGILGIGDYTGAQVAEFRIIATGGITPGHNYVISGSDTGNALGVQDAETNGLPAVQVKPDRMLDQQWVLRLNDDGTVSFVSAISGKTLHVEGGKPRNGVKVVQWDDSPDNINQKWLIMPAGNDQYSVVSAIDRTYALDRLETTGDQAADMVVRRLVAKGAPQRFSFFDVTDMRKQLDDLAQEYMGVIPDGKHVIVSVSDGRSMLDTRLSYTTGRSGAQVRLTGSSTNLLWEVVYDENGYASIKNMESEMVLSVDGNQPMVGASVIQAEDDNSLGQKWIIIPQEEEEGYRVQSALWSDLVMDMVGSGWSKNNEANVIVWTATDSKSQVWAFGWQTPERILLQQAEHFSDVALDEWKEGMTNGIGQRGGKRYTALFPVLGTSWDCSFTAWCMAKAGLVPGSTMPETTSTAKQLYNYYLSHPWLADIHPNDGSYVPQLGDIALKLEPSDNMPTCAIVAEVGNGYYYDVEGDCNNQVEKVERDASAEWSCFISINWAEIANRS